MHFRPKAFVTFLSLPTPAALLLLLLPFAARHAAAQAEASEYKTQSIAAFAGYLHDNIDFYPKSDNGVTFGLDVTRHIPFPVQPSLEGRANMASGPLANERSYLGGFKGEYRIRRYVPYVDFLVGFGTIHFNPAANFFELGDNSTVYSPGAGVDIDLSHHFRAKIDFQHQYWNTGNKTEFQPNLLTLGLSYPVPFRPFHRHGEPHW